MIKGEWNCGLDMMVTINMKKTYVFRMYLKVKSTELGDGLGDGGVNERERSGIFSIFLA